MCDITSGLFEHIETTYTMDVDQRVSYTQCILRGAALKNYKAVLVECNQSANDLAGDSWYLGELKEISTDNF